KSAMNKKLVITIEENTGALAEKVASSLSENRDSKILSFKLPDKFTSVSGSRDRLLNSYGLSPEKIYKSAKRSIL
ncbi:MAG: hypothetical protein ACP5U0_10490, partial [Caldisphaera sp.]